MSDDKERISLTIIKRSSKGGHAAHHGGAWKIAYADFVTAMMAFFLLMWLLGSTTKGEKAGIADFFNQPLRVALTGGPYSGGATSILDGGGKDFSQSQIGDTSTPDSDRNKQKASSAAQQREEDMKRLRGLKAKIEKLIDQNIKLKPFKNQIRLDITSEGLRIQIMDAQNRPMFASGSPILAGYTKSILDEIGVALNDVDNKVSIAGHTDSMPYSGGEKGYSNWELSSERANAARRELIAGGMTDGKVIQVRGLADALPLDKHDASAPMNRRISILVLNQDSLTAFLRDGGRTDVSAPGEASAAIGSMASGGQKTSSTAQGDNVTVNPTGTSASAAQSLVGVNKFAPRARTEATTESAGNKVEATALVKEIEALNQKSNVAPTTAPTPPIQAALPTKPAQTTKIDTETAADKHVDEQGEAHVKSASDAPLAAAADTSKPGVAVKP